MARRDDDDAPWLAEGVREERSTLVPRARLVGGGLLALALAVLVALGVYLAAGTKTDGSKGYARAEDAPLIAADPGPYKVPPADPGGAQVGGVSDSLAAAGQGAEADSAIDVTDTEEPLARPGTGPTDLLPATIPPAPVAVAPVPLSPAPATRPDPTLTPARSTPAPSPAAPTTKPPAAIASARPSTRSADAVTADQSKPATPKPAKSKPVPTDLPAPVDLLPPTADPRATPRHRTRTETVAAPDATKLDAPIDTPKSRGRTTLQLGAFSSPEKAEAAWAKADGDGALSGLAKRIEPVEHDGKTLYRLRAGGVVPDAAAALCARLKAAGAACIVAQ